MRISTAIAVTLFNDGEISLYGLLSYLELNPSYISFRSLCMREKKRKQHLTAACKKNIDRRARRQTTMRERRERDLLRAEGGCSYKSSSFGSEVTPTPTRGKGTLASTRGKGIKRLLTSADSPLASTRRKGVKRHLTSADSSEPSSDTDVSTASGSSTDVCDICERRQPPSQTHRTIYGKAQVQWVGSDECDRWFHKCCTELDDEVDVSTIDYICLNCI